jgi:ribose-phosphate pyrophosphokinase
VPPFRLKSSAVRDKLTVLDAASLFAEAIRCIHNDESIVALLEN